MGLEKGVILIYEWIFLALLALSFGSFLNVLIVRVPKEESIVLPHSHCPECREKLKWWHNIPLISYILLKGKCAYCKERISFVYPIVEFLTMFIFLVVFMKMGLSQNILENRDPFLISIIFSLLLTLSVIDIRYKAVPDSISLSALTISLFLFNIIDTFSNALLLAGGFTFLRFYVSFILKKEAMGEGDIIIAGIIGAMLGVKLAMVAIFLSSILALPISLFFKLKKDEPETPYIPFLGLATFIVFMFDSEFLYLLRLLHG